MITIYSATETTFTSLGLGALMPLSCTVTEDINGQYELYIEHPIDENGKWEHLVNDRIIKAPTHDGEQLFRIYSAIKNPVTGIVEVNARHVFYDLLDNLIEDTRPTIKDGDEAGEAILDGCQYETSFTFESDIEETSTAYYIRVNPVQAFIGSALDQSFINRWGGEIRRNNFAISINERRGSDKGVRIAYGKNLTGLEAIEDISKVQTRIMPTALDITNTVMFTDAKYYDSPLINNYSNPKIGILDTGIVVGLEVEGTIPYATEAAAKTAMAAMAQAAFDDGADKPKLTINVSFIRWQDTDEYKVYADLYTLELGDDVTVDYEPLDLTYDLRVTSIVWDAVLNKAEEIILGDLEPNIAQSLVDIGSDLDTRMADAEGNMLSLEITASGLRADITDAEGDISTLEITASSLTSRMSTAEGDISTLEQFADELTLSVTNGETSSIIKLMAGTTEISSKSISFSGLVSFANLQDGTTTISGSNIKTGTISADRIATEDLIVQTISNVDEDCYGVIGELEDSGLTYKGLDIYDEDNSTSVPSARFLTYNGSIYLYSEAGSKLIIGNGLNFRDENGTQRVLIGDATNDILIYDKSGNIVFGHLYGSNTYLKYGSNWLGVDSTGVFKQIGATKTYL